MYLASSPFNLLLRCNTVFCYRVYLELAGAAWESKFSPMMITKSAVSLTSKELVICVSSPHTPCILSPPVKAPKKPIQVVYVPSHLFHMLFELFKVSGCSISADIPTTSAFFSCN